MTGRLEWNGNKSNDVSMVCSCLVSYILYDCNRDKTVVVFVGLGSLYGDHELHDENMDRQAELRIVEKYLSKNLEILM